MNRIPIYTTDNEFHKIIAKWRDNKVDISKAVVEAVLFMQASMNNQQDVINTIINSTNF